MSIAAKIYNKIILNRIREPVDAILRPNQAADTLAPFLFIIVLDYVMRKAEADNTNDKGEHGFITNLRESVRRPATSLNDLDFADDIALLENSLEQSQLQLQYTSNRAKEVGLEVNIKKTEEMTNQAKNGTIKLDGETIKWVENFKYLGSMIVRSICAID